MLGGYNIKRLQSGDQISAAWLNSLLDMLMSYIIGGDGIEVRRVGNFIVISASPANRQIIPKV